MRREEIADPRICTVALQRGQCASASFVNANGARLSSG